MGGCNCCLPRTVLKQHAGKVLEGTQLFSDLLLWGRVLVIFLSRSPGSQADTGHASALPGQALSCPSRAGPEGPPGQLTGVERAYPPRGIDAGPHSHWSDGATDWESVWWEGNASWLGWVCAAELGDLLLSRILQTAGMAWTLSAQWVSGTASLRCQLWAHHLALSPGPLVKMDCVLGTPLQAPELEVEAAAALVPGLVGEQARVRLSREVLTCKRMVVFFNLVIRSDSWFMSSRCIFFFFN